MRTHLLRILAITIAVELALPTYAASAWYHHKLPEAPQEMQPLLEEVEHFAMTDYAHTASLKALHDNVAAFIRKTENSKGH